MPTACLSIRRAPICDPSPFALPEVTLIVQQVFALAPAYPWRPHASDALVLHQVFLREVLELAAPKLAPAHAKGGPLNKPCSLFKLGVPFAN
eukprot:6192177-Lingulodinium_polyedra.AAC.1